MISLNLKNNKKFQKLSIKEDVLFNALLLDHPDVIKKMIKSAYPMYKISNEYFEIVNKYIDFTSEGVSLYPGLIVRTNLAEYAILFLENTEIDEEYMVMLIKEFITDIADYLPKEININMIEIDKEVFLSSTRNI